MQSFYNPACTGNGDKLDIIGTYSAQMMGVDNAARTMYFGADMPLLFINDQHGVGLGFFNETIGFFTNQRFLIQYAYHANLFRGRLSGGIQVEIGRAHV